MWQEAIQADLASDAAAKALRGRREPRISRQPGGEPCPVSLGDFLTNAYLQLAQDKRARAIVDERNSVAELSRDYFYLGHTAFGAIPVHYAIERGAWAEAAALQVPRTPYPQAEAITWFGRALGAARSADLADARCDVDEIARLRTELTSTHDAYWTEQLDVQAKAAKAWIALGEHVRTRPLPRCARLPIARPYREAHRHGEPALADARVAWRTPARGQQTRRGAARVRAVAHVRAEPVSLAGRSGSGGRPGRPRGAGSFACQRLLVLARDADSERVPLKAAREFLATH